MLSKLMEKMPKLIPRLMKSKKMMIISNCKTIKVRQMIKNWLNNELLKNLDGKIFYYYYENRIDWVDIEMIPLFLHNRQLSRKF